MASPQPSIFEQLRSRNDSATEEKKMAEAAERDRRQLEDAQRRQAELIEANSTLPCTIGAVRVLGAQHTRHGFLQKVCAPLINNGPDRAQTLGDVVRQAYVASEKLNRFDIFEYPISMHIGKSDPTNPSSTPNDLDVTYEVKERPRLTLKTGTDVGNAEGSAYGNLLYRNLLGGGETLSLNAALGTRTRSAYQGSFDAPLFGHPDLRLELGGVASATQKAWARHEEAVRSGWAKLRWLTATGHRHEVAYAGAWRQVTGLAQGASPTVRADAGNSVKSALGHAWTCDRRDHPLLPSRGYLARVASELAGWGPLGGDVASFKSEVETQGTVPIPILRVKESGVSFTTGLRAGLLYPLGQASEGKPLASRINDRFQLGGPTDVRGFRISGIGPRDGLDAVGGDLYVAGSANLLLPVPGVGPERPLRWQLFLNGGRLLGLRDVEKDKDATGSIVPRSVRSAVAELGDGLPSTAAGIGLVYAHPMARFELNFTLPLIVRRGEDARKGLQFGIGISFL